MAKSIFADGFVINDPNGKIKVGVMQGLDLLVEQVRDGKSVFLTQYSNPGTYFFGTLLKTLHMHGEKLPEIPVGRNHDEFQVSAKSLAADIAASRFPIEYTPGAYGRGHVSMSPVYIDKVPHLSCKTDSGEILINLSTARKLVEKIPKIYNIPTFSILRNQYLIDAKKFPKTNQLVKHIVRPVRKKPRQLLFDFMKNMKRRRK